MDQAEELSEAERAQHIAATRQELQEELQRILAAQTKVMEDYPKVATENYYSCASCGLRDAESSGAYRRRAQTWSSSRRACGWERALCNMPCAPLWPPLAASL